MRGNLSLHAAFAIIVSQIVGCGQKSVELHILTSGDTAGWITPCGCTANQSGGLERRATLIQSIGDKDSRIYLDAGGSASDNTEYQKTKFAAILDGIKLIGIEAHNIGANETELSPSELFEIAKATQVSFVSANLKSVDATVTITPSKIISRGAFQVLVTGVIAPTLVENDEWVASDPLQAAIRILQSEEADCKIVLAYMPEPELIKFAQSLPEANIILGGPTGQVMQPTTTGAGIVASATNKGKFISHLKAIKRSGKVTVSPAPVLEVKSDLELSELQTNNLHRYLETLKKTDFSATETGLSRRLTRASDQLVFAGSESCKQCHSEIFRQWQSTKHAHAWQTLEQKKSHVDPACQLCHTTGYGETGGFEAIRSSLDRVDVGCESCHGPSALHNRTPTIRTPWTAKTQCASCHDHENSPTFQLDSYWAKIAHGQR
jgi:2',3'-cyclic-nucleotide 2'-phosphodiesterase (5'-nucleotidase family)